MLRKTFKYLALFVAMTILLPISLGAALGYAKGWPENWRVASWSSSGMLPEAKSVQPATVMILSTRTGRWKSIFAEHMSIVLKTEGASRWTRYDVVGWGTPVRRDAYAADALWYGNTPRVIFRLEGAEAAKLIPAVEASIARLPAPEARQLYGVAGAEFQHLCELGGPAHGRFQGGTSASCRGERLVRTWLWHRRGTQQNRLQLFGWRRYWRHLAWEEGVELHLLGSTIGLDPNDLAIKLPALGKLSLLNGTG